MVRRLTDSERETERERERETDTQRDTKTDTQRQIERQTETERHREKQTARKSEREGGRIGIPSSLFRCIGMHGKAIAFPHRDAKQEAPETPVYERHK